MHKYLIWIIVIIASIITGFYLSILINKYSVFGISPTVNIEIDPFEVLSLIATIILAIYVTNVLDKRKEKSKTETDILLQYLIEFKKDLSQKFDELSKKADVEIVQLNASCKVLRKRLHSIIDIAEAHGFITKGEKIATDLKDKIRKVWELLTDTPKEPAANVNRATKDGILTLRKEKLSMVENEIIEIERLIFDLIVKFNLK